MTRNFVIIGYHLISTQDKLRFGCDAFTRRGYAARAVSCWHIFGKGHVSDLERGQFVMAPDVAIPETWNGLLQILDSLSPADFILVTAPFTKETSPLFLALSERNLRYSSITLGKLPITFNCLLGDFKDIATCLRMKIREFLEFLRRARFRFRQMMAIGTNYLKVKPPLFCIRGGTYSLHFVEYIPKLWRAEIIDVASFDLAATRLPAPVLDDLPDHPYAVYLDVSLRDHPDWLVDGGTPDDLDETFADLRRTFDKLEKDLGLSVVIALHPKTSYTAEEIDTLFGGRQVFRNATRSLVRNANLVLGHASTAYSFAVIHRKPVLFLTNTTLSTSPDGIFIEIIASWLGHRPLDMSRLAIDSPRIELPAVNERHYARYFEKFLCAKGGHADFIWDHVIDRFETRIGTTPPVEFDDTPSLQSLGGKR